MKVAMQLIKNTSVLLIITGVIFFAAGLVQADEVIEEWVARYNGPGDNTDKATAIALDDYGNIYITGISFGSGIGLDYATIKYDSAGNEIWIRRYNGPGNSADWGRAIAVDDSGNVYVTGQSLGSGTSYDYATIKYDSDGGEQWVRRYNGPGNDEDDAYAITIDGSGNICITGYSTGSGTDYDYATIKYDPNGNELWVARYDGPANNEDWACAIAVDGSGNIYVAGRSFNSSAYGDCDYTTIKYDPNGGELWVRRYNGPGDDTDSATAIAVDGSGNIYITGFSEGSGTYSDYATIKYDTNGIELWVSRHNGPGNGYDRAYALAVDGPGNIYVTGHSRGSDTNSDYATIKYDSDGNEIWIRRYNGPANLSDYAHAIVVDSSGNIYVTGHSAGSGTSEDYATIKYDSDGNEIWVLRYDGPGNAWDRAQAIAADSSGNIYVTGYSYGSGTSEDYATIKYNQNPIFLTLTMQTEPADVNTVTPPPGEHEHAQGTTVDISAQRFVDCPDVYVFDHWEGDVNDPNSANTTVFMDTDKTVTTVFIDGRQCGDECHPYPDGDLYRDCRVNFFDMAVFANNWLACTDPNCD